MNITAINPFTNRNLFRGDLNVCTQDIIEKKMKLCPATFKVRILIPSFFPFQKKAMTMLSNLI